MLPIAVPTKKLRTRRKGWSIGKGSPVCQFKNVIPDELLDQVVLMMEPAEDWYRCDAADFLPPPELWSILIQ